MSESPVFLTFCVFLCVAAATAAAAGDSPLSSEHKNNLQCTHPREKFGCVRKCPPLPTCGNRFAQFLCPIGFENMPCSPSCYCEKGFYRNSVGDCVTAQQCDMCSGPNEYFSCGSACDNVCSELQTQNQTNCPIKNIVCNNKCYCENGYARNEDNICVPIAECETSNKRVRRTPAQDINCGVNEIYTPCKKTCPPETCISLIARFKCDSKEVCKPGCRCKDGYLRIKDGSDCIPLNQCQQLANAKL